MADQFRYAAFVSYSSKDSGFARRLHRALERYGIPSSLGKFDLTGRGKKKNRIYPVFRDREELGAGSLSERIEEGLRASGALIVVCSPYSAASPWVQKEIEFFAGLGRGNRIFAVVSENAPLIDEEGKDATAACFPQAFRGGALADPAVPEPLAADARKGKDGFKNAWLKIVAGLISVNLGELLDRQRARERRQVFVRLALAVSIVSLAIGTAIGVGFTQFTIARTTSQLLLLNDPAARLARIDYLTAHLNLLQPQLEGKGIRNALQAQCDEIEVAWTLTGRAPGTMLANQHAQCEATRVAASLSSGDRDAALATLAEVQSQMAVNLAAGIQEHPSFIVSFTDAEIALAKAHLALGDKNGAVAVLLEARERLGNGADLTWQARRRIIDLQVALAELGATPWSDVTASLRARASVVALDPVEQELLLRAEVAAESDH
jgi:MTH538 TIR-like domain (DUF1863)